MVDKRLCYCDAQTFGSAGGSDDLQPWMPEFRGGFGRRALVAAFRPRVLTFTIAHSLPPHNLRQLHSQPQCVPLLLAALRTSPSALREPPRPTRDHRHDPKRVLEHTR